MTYWRANLILRLWWETSSVNEQLYHMCATTIITVRVLRKHWVRSWTYWRANLILRLWWETSSLNEQLYHMCATTIIIVRVLRKHWDLNCHATKIFFFFHQKKLSHKSLFSSLLPWSLHLWIKPTTSMAGASKLNSSHQHHCRGQNFMVQPIAAATSHP